MDGTTTTIACIVLGLSALMSCRNDAEEATTDESKIEADDSLSVSAAVMQSCTTAVVSGLATQLVEEINCMAPGSLARIDDRPGFKLDPAVFPYLQAPAASALAAAQSARGEIMAINSALRTLPQQYLLHRWSLTGRCGIRLAASPGGSNHESGTAVDIESHAAWLKAMTAQHYEWYGAADVVHFDFLGAGTIDLSGLSVLAFQRRWNRAHPKEPLPETGQFDAETEKRLAKAPARGFAEEHCAGPALGVDVDGGPDAQAAGTTLQKRGPSQ
jgi:hypothetical protein